MKTNILDFIDYEKVNVLLEGFNKSTGFLTAILDLEGNVLAKSGWRQICTEFHRIHPDTVQKCKMSDTELANKMAAGEKYHFYKCLNGLIDVAVPIVIQGKHVGNLFSGQFFLEKPDANIFAKQAKKYNFDETKYLEALNNVPVVSEEKVKIAMDFLLNLTNLISEMTQQKLEQIALNETIKKSEERWQFAIEENGDGLFDWNVETNDIFFSEQWRILLGYKADEIENKLEEWDKRVHPDDKAKAHLDLQKHLDGHTAVYVNEQRLLCKNGNYKWILARGKIISRTDEGRPLRLIGTHRDITEQKNAEKELVESEEKFQLSFHSSPVAQAILKLNGEFVEANQAFSKLVGYSSDEIVGKTAADIGFLSLAERKKLAKEVDESSGSISNASVKFKAKDGRLRDILYSVEAISLNGVKHRLSMGIDITEQKKAEKALKISEERFRDLYNNSPDMYASISPLDASILQCNETLLRNLGYNREEIIGAPIYKVYHESCKREVEKAFQQFIETGEVSGKELLLKRKDGCSIDVSLNVNSVKDNKGKILYSISSWRDISTQKKAVEELKKEKKFLEVVFDSISDGIVACDANGVLNRFNKATIEFHGLPSMQIAADTWAEYYNLYFPDGKTPMQLKDVPLYRALNEGLVEETEMMIIPKKGKQHLLVCNGRKLIDEDGNTLGAVVAMHDITEEKRVQEELKESEEKFRLAFHTSPDSININRLDDGLYVDINESFIQITGYTREETIGKTSGEINIWTSSEDRSKLVKGLLNDGKVENLEAKFKLKDGRIIDGLMSASIISINNVPHILSITRDITDRKRADEAIKEAAANLKAIIDNREDFIWSLDREYNYIIFNKPYADLILKEQGVKLEKGMSAFNSEPAEIQDFWKSKFKPVFEGENVVFEFTQKLNDTDHYFQFFLNPIISEGRVTGASVLGMDITERKLAEKELKDSLEREIFWAEIVKNANVGIAVGYPDGRLGSSNTAYQEITGYSGEELLGIDWNKVLTPPEYIESEMVFLEELHKTKKPVVYEKEYIRKDGSRVPIELKVNPGFGKEGNIEYYFAFVADITERKEIVKILQDRNSYIESIMENMPIGFALNSISDGEVKYMNNVFEEIYGWSREILTNTSIFFEKIFPDPAYREQMRTQIIADMESGDPARMNWKDLKVVTSTGGVRYVHAFNIPLIEQNLMISTVQDTTKRKMAEDELIQHKQNLENLVSQRTNELKEKNDNLERMNRLFVGRELRMVELKEKIKELENK
ncbi:MAG: PAS domain S-box protein [Prolixibacteraceae bacterium]